LLAPGMVISVAAGIKSGANRQLIAADDAAGRVKQIEVTGLFFG
jgi:hypothetical protein